MLIFIVSILLITIGAFGKAVCDAIKSSWHATIFSPKYDDHQWMNPSISWRNKWKNGIKLDGPRYFGSSTFLVWLTDLWHFAQLIWLNAFIAGIILFVLFCPWVWSWWVHFLVIGIGYKVFFELFYSQIIINKD